MAKVQIPSNRMIEERKEMVEHRHPHLSKIWCTVDGIKLMLEQSGDASNFIMVGRMIIM